MTNVTDISEHRQDNMEDDQTMAGFEGGGDGADDAQSTYLPPIIPEGYVVPPTGAQFANATWLAAGPEVERLVQEVLAFEEFADLRELDYEVVWRRRAAPMRKDGPIFAGVEIVPQRVIWQALQMGEEQFPRFWIDLYWGHFDALRSGHEPGSREKVDEEVAARSVSYVFGGILQQHLHHALSGLSVDNDIITRQHPDFAGFANTIKRFGMWTSGATEIARQLALWPGLDDA